MLTANKKYVFIGIILTLTFGLGSAIEYKFKILEEIQNLRKSPAKLPRLPMKLGLGFEWSDSFNNVETIDPPPPGEFSTWRVSVRKRILEETGITLESKSHPVEIELLSEKVLNGVRQQFVLFTSFDGAQIPAYIHSPIDRSSLPLPGIVVVPGHVREGQSGIEQLANEPESYQHAAAARLARAGFVTLTFELRGFGYTGRPFGTEHVIVAYNAFLQDHSYKALVIQDTQAAVAILRSMDRVDKDKIGIAGASYGGEIAVNYAALDESIKVIISHSAFGYTGRKGMKKGGTRNQPHYCHLLPNVDSIVRREYWYWMLAPRPVLGIRGDQDAPHFADVFDIYNQGWEGQEGLELKVQSGGHEFFVQPSIEFFNKHLK